jgi:uncharacterized protein (DUF2235 family)
MPKKTIIFCADGTWNGPEDATGESVLESADVATELTTAALTNVVKLYSNLAGATLPEAIALKNEDEKVLTDSQGAPIQVCKYLHGVGDSNNILVKFMGGIFGCGVVSRIVRGYTFISRYYEPGDDIHICGFSRGAYTARALAGVITQVGLLNPESYDPTSKMQAYRLGVAAWARSKTLQLSNLGRMTSVANEVIGTIERWLAASLQDTDLRPDVTLSSVAVWDTVGSMGIPEYIKGERSDILRFVDSSLNPKVKRGFHGMSVDEMRADFPVTKWAPRESGGITQTWFVGAHADVGGGYAPSESGLSNLALTWMMDNLRQLGVVMHTPPVYEPECSKALSQPIHTPWTNPPFDHLGQTPRDPKVDDDFHPSVKQRWETDSSYRPKALQEIWVRS